MPAKGGRLEAQFTTTGALTASFTDSGGTTVVSVPAGSYYFNQFLTEIDNDLGANWTISVSDGEGGVSAATGRVTIQSSATPFSVTFTSTLMRDILGFTGNVASTSSPATGANHVYGMWLPGCAKFTRHGDSDAGTLITDFRTLVSPSGDQVSFYGNKYRVIDGVRWEGVQRQRVRTFAESVTNESLETFYLMTQLADSGVSIFSVGSPIRFYWDADVDGTYRVVKAQWPPTFDPNTWFQGYTGLYVIDMPRLKVES